MQSFLLFPREIYSTLYLRNNEQLQVICVRYIFNNSKVGFVDYIGSLLDLVVQYSLWKLC